MVHLNYKCHVLFARQLHPLALPQRVVYCEGVYCDGQVLCVHLWKAFATWVIPVGNVQISIYCNWINVQSLNSLEELIEHDFVDLTRSRAIELQHLVGLGHVTVEGAELAARIPEEYKEVFGLRPCDLLEHFLLGLSVDGARKNAVLDGIQYNTSIGFGRWLFIEFWTCQTIKYINVTQLRIEL